MATAPPEPEKLEVRAHGDGDGEDGDTRVTMDDSDDDSDDDVVQTVSLGSKVKVRAVDDVTKAHATRHKSTRQSERGHMVD